MRITLDTFFEGEQVTLANLSAQYGTTRTNRVDSVWNGETYGGTVENFLGQPANPTALEIELRRGASVVGVDVEIQLDADDPDVNVIVQDVLLTITEDGVDAAA